MLLNGKTAFITGTARGIGHAMVETFAREGASVIAHARKETPEFVAWVAGLSQKYGVSIRPVYFDMVDTEAMKSAVRALVAEKVPINVLVNNAGIQHSGLFQMTPMAKVREVFNVNFFATLELTQLLIRYIARNGGGSIINMASNSGVDLIAGNCAYGVSKAAIVAFTKTLAGECGSNGIRVNAIAPGLTDTDMAKQQQESSANGQPAELSAMRRKAKPDEIAEVAAFLASDRSSFMNGAIVRVDGGGVEHRVYKQ